LGLSHVDKMSLQDKEHQYKLCSFWFEVRACIGVLYLALTFCQRLTAPDHKEQSLYWCSLSCSDILSTIDRPKSTAR
jgi:hypothetical protein